MNTKKPTRVATYVKSATDDRRATDPIEVQQQEIAKWLKDHPDAELVGEYVDRGVSGLVPMGNRPAGARLMRAAEAHGFDELLVCDIDRIGRSVGLALAFCRHMEKLGIKLVILRDTRVGFTQPGFTACLQSLRNTLANSEALSDVCT